MNECCAVRNTRYNVSHGAGAGKLLIIGDKKGQWSITVTGNWRITFEFIDGNAYIVNYKDYH
ncbi:plasmid maintenance system killer protein [Brenneria nigrifluens DSM 30175 = ATCC 13028]|uniref:Plasmid maintenance system killer protein n=1 Tax=Brenneria nigrifluens DSM 30175 = ATCC 13028 TaxID=1121120 RepID=A0A2U1UVJ4_9GAMM|nr:plasmid maintenance system killer protein [Brenneria nigrifluens DSM 30175 = ATCC 13028]QCR06813.1 plasmid maintenance system killer protein [Brenneria nigrifluens DSM 30175 = ATCC 13028]